MPTIAPASVWATSTLRIRMDHEVILTEEKTAIEKRESNDRASWRIGSEGYRTRSPLKNTFIE